MIKVHVQITRNLNLRTKSFDSGLKVKKYIYYLGVCQVKGLIEICEIYQPVSHMDNAIFRTDLEKSYKTIQFVIFKTLRYCFKERIRFDVKASFTSRP